MPSLYRPKIVTYRLPSGKHRTADGKRVTRDTPGAVRTVEKAKKWYGRYTDAAGQTQRVPLSESKETARRMLNKVAGDAELGSVGLTDPLADFRRRPLLEYVEEHVAGLRAKGRTEEHCRKVGNRVMALCEGCGFATIDDLDPDAATEFLAGLRRADDPPPLDPAKEWYTTAEAAPLMGVAAASLIVQRNELSSVAQSLSSRRLLLSLMCFRVALPRQSVPFLPPRR